MASTDARPIARKNVAYRVTFPILDADGDLVTGATSLDSEVSKDGGTFADCTNEATEIATSSGMYYLDLTSDEMNADTVAVIVKTGTAGAKTTPLVIYPEEAGDVRCDVVQLSGDATAADNAEAFFDGTGYAGTGNVIPTVTTLTGHTPQTGDTYARLGAPAGASVSADIAAIEAQTDDIGAAGAGLTAVPWNSAWDAEVQSEVDDALVAQRLDEILNADSDIDGAAPPTVGSVVHEMLSKTAGSFTFDQTTDSLEALRDNQQVAAAAALTAYDPPTHAELVSEINDVQADIAALVIPTAAANADAVWDEAIAGHLGAGSTGAALNAAGSAGDPWSTPLPGAYGAGTAGKIVGDNVNATISSRASQASVDAVQADTDDIQTRLPASLLGGRMDANVGALSGDVTAADNAEAFFDGTGYAGTGNTIPTVTTLTGHTPQTGDSFARLGAPAGASVSADIAAIEGQTDDIGAAGAGLTAVPWNAAWDAEVQNEVADALAVYDPPTHAELVAEVDAAQADIAGVLADTNDIQSRLPAALVSGRIDASVGAMAAGVVTAAAVATGAVDADALAADAVAEIQAAVAAGTVASVTGNVAGSVGSLAAQAKADVNAEVVDVLNADTFAELSAVPDAAATFSEMVRWIYLLARNTFTQTESMAAIKADDGSTDIATAAVSDDSTTFTRSEWQ